MTAKFRYKGRLFASGHALVMEIIKERGFDPAKCSEWRLRDGQFQFMTPSGIWARQYTTDGLGVHNLREGNDT